MRNDASRIEKEIAESKKYIAMTIEEKKEYFLAEEKSAKELCPNIIAFFGEWMSFDEFDRVKSAPANWTKEDISAEMQRYNN